MKATNRHCPESCSLQREVNVGFPGEGCRKSPNLSHSPQGVASVFFAPGEGLLLVFEIHRKETAPSPGANYALDSPGGE